MKNIFIKADLLLRMIVSTPFVLVVAVGHILFISGVCITEWILKGNTLSEEILLKIENNKGV